MQKLITYLKLLIVGCSVCSWPLVAAVVTDIQSLPVLIKQIQQGGHVLYLRHAPTEPKTTDSNRQAVQGGFSVNYDDCSSQRNLSSRGREVASNIKKHLQRLQIPIGSVASSPYCRALDTAKIIFQQVTVDYDLAYSLSKNSTESKRLGQYLAEAMHSTEALTSNTVFVGHSTNLRDGLGVWPKPEGVLVVFKKQGNDLIYKGMIVPDDWREIAAPP
ncbi:MAG: hypothetical protein OFPI_15660 [Osedax symbiont Rs2]|nr:MAG: hypothetical protein OFPI_15660 [Osedax symbiont Rs2]